MTSRMHNWMAALVLSTAIGFWAQPAMANARNAVFVSGVRVRMVLPNGKEQGFKLVQRVNGWHLTLAAGAKGAVAEITDVTRTAGLRWNLPIVDSGVELDEDRFLVDHAYHVRVVRNRSVIADAFLYLAPSHTPIPEHELVLGDVINELSPIAIIDKGQL